MSRKMMLQQPLGLPNTEYQSFVRMPPAFLPHQRMHIPPPHHKVSHQLHEALRSLIETCNNNKTSGKRRDLHLLAVSLAGCG